MALTRSASAWLAAYGLVALVNVVSVLIGLDVLSFVTLLLAMPTLIGALLAARPVPAWWGPVAAALVFSWLGDWAAELARSIWMKIAFFFAAQVLYAAAFWPFRARSVLRRPRWLLVYALVVGGLLAFVAPDAGVLAPAVIVYGCSLGLMAVLATGVHPLTSVGAASFLISDSLIALTTFVAPDSSAGAVFFIMASYLTGQLLIVLGVVFAGRPAR